MELIVNSKVHGIKTIYFDKNDAALVKKYTWHIDKNKRTFYVKAYAGRKENGSPINIKMHIILTGIKGLDHKDGNGLNNKRNNLREATQSQQGANTRVHKDSTTGFKGVTFRAKKGIYKARIRVNGKLIMGEGSKNLYKAALSYNEMALKYFGEFARINELTEEQLEMAKTEMPLKVFSNNVTGYRGVSMLKNKTYAATLRIDGKNKNLGNFDNPKDAAKAYNDAVIKYGKDIRRLNTIT